MIEYSDNYADTSVSSWQFKIDKVPNNNADLTIDNSQSLKYKAALAGKRADTVNNTNSFVKNTEIVAPLKYLSNFWRSLEMPLISCKIRLELNWIKDSILSSTANSAKSKITDAKLHIPIVNLSTKGNVSITKQLSNGFNRSVYSKNYPDIPAKAIDQRTNIHELLSVTFQIVRIIFVLAYVIAANGANKEAGVKDNKKYFLPRGKIENHID